MQTASTDIHEGGIGLLGKQMTNQDTWVLRLEPLPDSLCILGQLSYPLWAFPCLSIQWEARTRTQVCVTPESLI